MRIRFRTSCYGCRRRLGPNWHRAFGRWPGGHRFDWHYFIHLDEVRLYTSGPFATLDRAMTSARRAWARLEQALAVGCEVAG